MASVLISTGVALASRAIIGLLTPSTNTEQGKSDTKVQKSEYGSSINRIWGKYRIDGLNLIWGPPLREQKETESQGKGGGGASTTTFTYFFTGAFLIGEPVDAITRIWLNGDLVYDPNSTDADTASESLEFESRHLEFYDGSATQTPSPTIEEVEGVGNAPAFRHRSYLVLRDASTEIWGGGVPKIDVEVTRGPSPHSVGDIISDVCEAAGLEPSEYDVTELFGLTIPGARLKNDGSGYRKFLEELQQIFFITVSESEGKLFFITQKRQGIKAKIPVGDLAAKVSDGEPIARFEEITLAETEIPTTVEVEYKNVDNDYEDGLQYAHNPSLAHDNPETFNFDSALTDSQAATLASKTLYQSFIQRRTYEKIFLLPTYGKLKPGDVITIPVRGSDQPVQVRKISWGANNLIEVEANLYAGVKPRAVDLFVPIGGQCPGTTYKINFTSIVTTDGGASFQDGQTSEPNIHYTGPISNVGLRVYIDTDPNSFIDSDYEHKAFEGNGDANPDNSRNRRYYLEFTDGNDTDHSYFIGDLIGVRFNKFVRTDGQPDTDCDTVSTGGSANDSLGDNVFDTTVAVNNTYNTQKTIRSAAIATAIPFEAPLSSSIGFEVYVAVTATGFWNSGALYLSENGGNTYSRAATILELSTVGTVSETLSGTAQEGAIDTGTTLTLTLQSGDIESVSQAQFDANQSILRIGTELVGFRDVNPLGNDVYEISHLRRGALGTGSEIAGHSANEQAILVRGGYLVALPVTASDIGETFFVKPVHNGQIEANLSNDASYTVTGQYQVAVPVTQGGTGVTSQAELDNLVANANSIKQVPVNDSAIADGYVLSYNATNNEIEYVEQNGGSGGNPGSVSDSRSSLLLVSDDFKDAIFEDLSLQSGSIKAEPYGLAADGGPLTLTKIFTFGDRPVTLIMEALSASNPVNPIAIRFGFDTTGTNFVTLECQSDGNIVVSETQGGAKTNIATYSGYVNNDNWMLKLIVDAIRGRIFYEAVSIFHRPGLIGSSVLPFTGSSGDSGRLSFILGQDNAIYRAIAYEGAGEFVKETSGGAAQSLPGLLAYWEFEPNNRLVDSVGGYNLTIKNSVAYVPSGLANFGDAAQFDSNNREMLISNNSPDLATRDSFSVGGWINVRQDGSSDTLIARYAGSSVNNQFLLFRSGSKWRFLVVTNSSSYTITGTTSVQFNQYYFVVATVTTTRIELYVDGVLEDDRSLPQPVRQVTGSPITIGGHFPNSNTKSFHSNSDIAAAAIWETALTQSEIDDLYNGGLGRPFV